MISKAEATTALLEAKKAKGLTYEELATEIGQDKVWTAAAVMGQASVPSEVATALDLPRTTTYRILETLCVAGYAYRAASDDRYRLTIMVRGLSDGFDDEAWVTQIARPHMYELCRDLVWPVAIATLSGATMLIRQTTDHESPLAVEKRGPGFRVSILGSASGLAYLAFCPKEQRDTLLDMLAQSKNEADRPARNRTKIYETLVEARRQGYAVYRRKRRVSDELSLSVPVLVVTHAARDAAIRSALEQIDRLPEVTSLSRMIRIEEDL